MSRKNTSPFCVYTESGYPKLFKKIGLEGFKVIKSHDLKAAALVKKVKGMQLNYSCCILRIKV